MLQSCSPVRRVLEERRERLSEVTFRAHRVRGSLGCGLCNVLVFRRAALRHWGLLKRRTELLVGRPWTSRSGCSRRSISSLELTWCSSAPI